MDRELLFKKYIYESGTSQTAKDYFYDFANKYDINNTKNKRVLDIACNDGSQLHRRSYNGTSRNA